MEAHAPENHLQAEIMVWDPRLKFSYFVPHSPQNLEDASPFGWYTPGLHESVSMLFSAAKLPADVREPFTETDLVLQLRLRRLLWRSVIPVDVSSLLKVSESNVPSLFRVVLTNNSELAKIVDGLRFYDDIPFLHVSSVIGDGRLPSNEFDLDSLLHFVNYVVAHLSSIPEWQPFAEAIAELTQEANRKESRALSLGSSLHNVTAPNELALVSFGYDLGEDRRLINPGVSGGLGDPQAYIDRICLSADTVSAERRSLMADSTVGTLDNELLVSIPSVYWGHYWKKLKAPKKLAPDDKKAYQAAFKAIVHQSSYFDTFADKDARSLIENGLFQSIMQSRAADQRCYTAGLSLLSANTLTPVLRLEPKINQTRKELHVLAHCARSYSGADFQERMSRLARKAAKRMRSLVDHEFLSRIDAAAANSFIGGMKVVSEVPLEFLPCDGLPLGMRFDLSRIPVTPGNLFLSQCVDSPIRINMSALRDILIIRSYDANDVLRPILEDSIDLTLSDLKESPMNVRFVDVHCVDGLIEALKEFSGAILIFDGHGSFEDKFGVGTFVIGGEPVEIWSLKEKCEFPPIVIYCACDTHPLDGSHGSSANAAFLLGAKTVLATSLPIDGLLASVFISRLMLRIHSFVPIALKEREILTWREIVSGLLRMSHTTETTRLLQTHSNLSITKDAYERVHLAANIAINNRMGNWFEIYLDNLSSESSLEVDLLRTQILRWASITDSMKYIQIGSPENIVISSDSIEQ